MLAFGVALVSGVLKLFIEEPFVDLDPRKAGGLDGSLPKFAIHLAICFNV